MRIALQTSGLALAACLLVATGANAAPINFVGSDNGSGSLATSPSSVAARASFDAAAGLLGSISTVDFETAPTGAIANTAVGGGVTVDDLGASWLISNNSGGSGSLFGYNTTPGGQFFATSFGVGGAFSGGTLVVSFAAPIQAFGAYVAGIQVASQTVTYNDGSNRTINIPLLANGGTAFLGFTDAGADVMSIAFNFGSDYVTVDDMRYVASSATEVPVPEPASLSLLGMGLAGLVARRRRNRAAAKV